jgi:uncharacterized protein YjdB
MKTLRQRAFSPWAFAAVVVIFIAGFAFTGCRDGLENDVAVTGVTLNEETLELEVGETATLTATVKPRGATNKTVSWSSSDETKATVSVDAVSGIATVSAVAAGTATITVTTEDGSKTATCEVTVTEAEAEPDPIAVSGVTLNETELELEEGLVEILTATVAPPDATNKKITWSSDHPEIATVSNGPAEDDPDAPVAGTVTAVSAGTATITVTTEDGDHTAECEVTVNPIDPGVIEVSGVTLNETELELEEGLVEILTATVAPPDATNKKITWSSDHPEIATVSNGPAEDDPNAPVAGTVTAVSEGTATITVTTADGNHTAECEVSVTPAAPFVVPVSGVTVSPKTLNLTLGGVTTGTLGATVAPPAATNKSVTWTSSDETKATVTVNAETGVATVSAVAAGTATITVKTTDGNKTDTCAVTVNPDPSLVASLTLSTTTLSLTGRDSGTLTVTVNPATATNKAVTWESGDENVATVSVNAVTGVATVTSHLAGSATITVTSDADNTKKATCMVTVNNVAVSGVTLNETELELEEGNIEVLTATIAPPNAINQNISWLSDDDTVATVIPGAGGTTATVTAIGEGTATITVTTADGNKTAKCEVSVKAADPGDILVTGVTVSAETLSLTLGGASATGTLSATVEPEDATNQNVSWSSDPSGIVTVTPGANGVATVTGVAAGTTTVTVTTQDGGETASCIVTVNPAPIAVSGVTLDKTELILLEPGTTGTLSATVAPQDATNKAVSWLSSDETKVTVSVDATTGVATVSGVAAGTATITVTTADGGKFATCAVTVMINELKGKIYYGLSPYKTELSADLTFRTYDTSNTATGSYTYDSIEKTFTLTPTWIGGPEASIPFVLSYTITPEGALLAQKISTNKGEDEVKGRVLTSGQGATVRTFTFAETGNTYTMTRQGVTTLGTYYYDSIEKIVMFRPTLRDGKTMLEFYADNNKSAAATGNAFASDEYRYTTTGTTLYNIIRWLW